MNLCVDPPAFGLPSSEAESIAAICYCSLVAPESFTVDYAAPASHLVTQSLPTLHDPVGDVWVAGFDDIVRYLNQQGLDADEYLSDEAKADAVAYSTLVERKAHDLTSQLTYLFSEENHGFTRSALAAGQSFPQNYMGPMARQKAALQRLEELSLLGESSSQGYLLGRHRQVDTVRHQARQIRIQNMADSLYSILETKLSRDAYLFGARPTGIDCLVFGHLSLHLFPPVPNDTLAKRIKESFPRTRKFLVDFHTRMFERKVFEVKQSPRLGIKEIVTSLWREIVPPLPPNQAKEAEGWAAKAAFIGGAIAVLIGFVISNKLIVLEFDEEEEEFQEYNQEDDDTLEDDDDEDDLD